VREKAREENKTGLRLNKKFFFLLFARIIADGASRRDREDEPTLIPCTNADAFCTAARKLLLNFAPAHPRPRAFRVRMPVRMNHWPRSRSAESRKHAIDCAPARGQVHDMRCIVHHAGGFSAVYRTVNLRERQNRTRLENASRTTRRYVSLSFAELKERIVRITTGNNQRDRRTDARKIRARFQAAPGPPQETETQCYRPAEHYDFDSRRLRFASRFPTAAEMESF